MSRLGSHLLAAMAVLSAVAAASGTGPQVSAEVLLELEPGEKAVDVVLGPGPGAWLAVTTFDGVGPGTGGDATDHLGPTRVHVDGQLLGQFRHVVPESVTFSTDGLHTAFVSVTWGKKGYGKYQVFLDGEPLGDPGHYSEQVEVGESLGPWFSPDGSRLVWQGNFKSGQYVVTGGKIGKGEHHDYLIMESPFRAGGRLVVVAGDGGQESLLCGGKVIAMADGIRLASPPEPGGAHPLAWVERHGDEERLVVEGKQGPAWASLGEVAWSQSGDPAYVALDAQGRAFLVRGNEAVGPWQEAATPAFAPGGGRLACLARTPSGTHLVLDGQPTRAWKAIEGFVFLDADRVAMVARDGERRFIVVVDARVSGSQEVASFQRVFRLVAGRGGELAASVLEAGRARVWVDGRLVGQEADQVRHCTLGLSPDGKHVAAALVVDGLDLMTLDGVVVGTWDRIACPVALGDEGLKFVGWRDGILERVSVTIP